MTNQDILQVIPDKKLPELKQIFEQGYPEYIHICNFVETTLQIKTNHPDEKYITIYAPEQDFSNGTFVAIIEMDCYHIFLFTLDKCLKRLEKSLQETKIIEWDKNPKFVAMHEDYHQMVFKVRNKIVQPCSDDIASYVWWLPKKKAFEYEFSIPEDIFVAPLKKFHADIINNIWPHSRSGTEKFLSKLIELNGGLGIFLKSNNELCAWVLKNYFGGIGMLQTANKHKRKGYGSLIVKIFAKIIAEQDNNDISGFIVKNNVASRSMFSKLGFKQLVETTPITWYNNINIHNKNSNYISN